MIKPTCPSAYSVFSTVVGDKKSLFRRFFIELSLNQSFSVSGEIRSSFLWPVSRVFLIFPRSAEFRARTVGVIRRGEDSSMVSISQPHKQVLRKRLPAHLHSVHVLRSMGYSARWSRRIPNFILYSSRTVDHRSIFLALDVFLCTELKNCASVFARGFFLASDQWAVPHNSDNCWTKE